MPREVEGYTQVLDHIFQTFGHEYLTVAEVAQISGYSKRRTPEKFYGWRGAGPGKRMPAAVLARQLCK